MIPDVLAEATRTQRWEDHIRSRCGDDAEGLILESHRKAIYQGCPVDPADERAARQATTTT